MLEKCKWNCWRKVVVIATAEVGNKVSLALENTLFCQIRTTGMWGRQRRWFWSFLYVPSLEFMKVRSDLCLGGIPWCILWRWWRSRCWCLQGQRAMWRNHLPGRQQSEKVGESWHCIFKMSLSGHWSLGVPFYCLLNCSRLLSVEFVCFGLYQIETLQLKSSSCLFCQYAPDAGHFLWYELQAF